MARYFAILAAIAALLPAGKAPPAGRGTTESVELTATLFHDKDAIRKILGSDLEGHYVVVRAVVRSRFGKEIEVRRDNFLLRTDKDGERSTPFTASQVAGRGALVISESGVGGTGVMQERGGPIWGGVPGTGSRPQRVGTDNNSAVGGGIGASETKGALKTAGKDVPPLQKVLEEKVLPEGKTEGTVSGLLYFPLGKQKVKDLELIYTAPDGKIAVRFR